MRVCLTVNLFFIFYYVFLDKHVSNIPRLPPRVHDHLIVSTFHNFPVIDALLFFKLVSGCLAVIIMIIWLLFCPIRFVKYGRFNCDTTCLHRNLMPYPQLPISSIHFTFFALYLNKTEIFLRLLIHFYDDLMVKIVTGIFRVPSVQSLNFTNSIILLPYFLERAPGALIKKSDFFGGRFFEGDTWFTHFEFTVEDGHLVKFPSVV